MNTHKLRFSLAVWLVGCALFPMGPAEARSSLEMTYYSQRYATSVGNHFGLRLNSSDVAWVYADVVNGGDGTAALTEALIRAGLDADSPFVCEGLMRSRLLAEASAFGTEVDGDAIESAVISTCGI